MQDLLDPLIDASFKGFPHHSAPLRRLEIGAKCWNVLRGDLPLPLAVIKQDVLRHNLQWMQDFANAQGVGLAPHGKTTLSPQLFWRQPGGAAGKRDLSYDWEMPIPQAVCSRSSLQGGPPVITASSADWKITGLNDQHAHLRGTGPEFAALQVGDLVCLGISHPCTTFDKRRWMPLVDANYTVLDAITTCF